MGKFFDTWKKIYGSKIAKASRDFLLGKDMDLSDEEYREKYGYNKPNNSVGIMGMLVAPEWTGVENLTKGISGFGGAKYNAGLEALEAEKQAQRALKVYDTMTKRDAFLKERFGKVWKEFTPEEQYGLNVRFRDKWLKQGGVIKAQNGTIVPYSNPNPINEWIRKTIDNVPALRSIKQGIEHYKSSPMHDIASFAIPDDIYTAMTPIAGPKNFIRNAERFHGLGKEAAELLTSASQVPLQGLARARVVNMIERLNTEGEKISSFELNRQIGRLKRYLVEVGREAAEDTRIMSKYKPYKEPPREPLDTKRIQKIVDSDLTPFDEMKTLQQTGSRAKTTMNFRMSDMMWKDGGKIEKEA